MFCFLRSKLRKNIPYAVPISEARRFRQARGRLRATTIGRAAPPSWAKKPGALSTALGTALGKRTRKRDHQIVLPPLAEQEWANEVARQEGKMRLCDDVLCRPGPYSREVARCGVRDRKRSSRVRRSWPRGWLANCRPAGWWCHGLTGRCRDKNREAEPEARRQRNRRARGYGARCGTVEQ